METPAAAEEIPVETPANVPAETPAPPPEPEKPATVTADPFAAIGSALSENKPEAQEHFIAAMAEKREKEAEEKTVSETKDWRHLKDKKGRYWTPGICSAKIDGKTGMPEKTKTGCWVILKGRKGDECAKRPPKRDESPQDMGIVNDAQAAAEMRQKQDEISAKVIFGLYYQASHQIFPEAAPAILTAENSTLHQHALKEWFATFEKGANLPPWLQAAAIFGSSALAMTMHPKSEKKRNKIKEALSYLWWKMTKRGRKPVAAASSQGGEGE